MAAEEKAEPVNVGLGMVTHAQHFGAMGKEDHHTLQANQSYRGAGKKGKRASWSPEGCGLSFLHPPSSVLNVYLSLSYNPCVGFLTENGW